MTTVEYTFRRLAEIAEQSPGYSISVTEQDSVFQVDNIRFERSPSGRKNKAVVLVRVDGREARIDSDAIAFVVD